MSNDRNTLKPVPVRRRSAARLAAIQLAYQSHMSGHSVTEFMPDFLQHYTRHILPLNLSTHLLNQLLD